MGVQEHDDVPCGGLGALSPRPDEAELGGVPDKSGRSVYFPCFSLERANGLSISLMTIDNVLV